MNYSDRRTTVTSAEQLRIRCLGRFRVDHASGREIHVRTRKARAVLAYLALTGGSAAREQIAALLWSDRGEEQARASVRQTLFELRRTGPGLIASHNGHVSLAMGSHSDLERIREAAAETDLEQLEALLADAEEGLLTDLDGLDPEFDSWLRMQRAHEPARTFASVRDAAQGCLDREGPRAAQGIISQLLRLDPTCEEASRLQLRIDQRLGDNAALHRHFDLLRERLREEYEAEPAAETVLLFEQLKTEPHRSSKAVADPGPPFSDHPTPTAPADGSPTRWLVAAALFLLMSVMVAALAAGWRPARAPQTLSPLLAVLPFEEQPPSNDFLAEGLWDQTRIALSRNPSLRLLGRATTEAVAGREMSAAQYRNQFGITHLLEGTVRRSGDAVLVSVSLSRTSDGAAIWQHMFRAHMAERINLQDAIATGIEGKLRARLAPQGGRRAEQIATTPEVYARYSEARELMASREPHNLRRAEALLREAVLLDENFAPGWSLLGRAIHMNGRQAIADARVRAEARAAVRRALGLAPNLAQAHAALALLEGEGSPTAERALRRAIALDPNYAEAWMWLGNSLNSQFRQAEAVAAYERAVEIDPLYQFAVQNLASTAIDLGNHAAVDRVLKRVTRAGADPVMVLSLRTEQLQGAGDYSAAYRLLAHKGLDARGRAPPKLWSSWFETLAGLGEFDALHRITGCPDWYAPMLRGEVLPPTTVEGRPVAPEEFWTSIFFSTPAIRAMVNRGRSAAMVRLYRTAFADADSFISTTGARGMLIELAPTVAIALKSVGADAEADYILSAAANRLGQAVHRSPGRWALAQLSAIRAVQGERLEALRLLEAARARGWLADGRQFALDLAEEPAFRELRSNPRFDRLRRRILAHIARERAELRADRVQHQPPR